MTAPAERAAGRARGRVAPLVRGSGGPHPDEDRELRRVALLVRLEALRLRRTMAHAHAWVPEGRRRPLPLQ